MSCVSCNVILLTFGGLVDYDDTLSSVERFDPRVSQIQSMLRSTYFHSFAGGEMDFDGPDDVQSILL